MPGFHMDHHPALELRVWDPVAQDTIPPSNDPAYLFGMTPDCHRKKTNRPLGPHTTLNSDSHAMAKGRHIRGETKVRPKRAWAKRSMRQDERPRCKDINDE